MEKTQTSPYTKRKEKENRESPQIQMKKNDDLLIKYVNSWVKKSEERKERKREKGNSNSLRRAVGHADHHMKSKFYSTDRCRQWTIQQRNKRSRSAHKSRSSVTVFSPITSLVFLCSDLWRMIHGIDRQLRATSEMGSRHKKETDGENNEHIFHIFSGWETSFCHVKTESFCRV